MKLDYKILGILAVAVLAIYVAGASGVLSSMTVVSGDEEISLPMVTTSSGNVNPSGFYAETDQYFGAFTFNGEWTHAQLPAGEYAYIKYSTGGDPFLEVDREDGQLKMKIAYADATGSAPAAYVYVEMAVDGSQDVRGYPVTLRDFDGSVHYATVSVGRLSDYDKNGDGVIQFRIYHPEIDNNYVNIYGVRLMMPISDSVDSCAGVTCPDKCVGTTRYTNGMCVDGTCKYSKTANSPLCGYDACAGVSCLDECDGTTKLYAGTCVDGACEYQRHDESVDCGWSPADPKCESYCDTDAHIKYYAGTYVNGVCTYETIVDSTECGFVTDPVDPNDPIDDDTLLLTGSIMAGAVVILSLVFVGLKMRK